MTSHSHRSVRLAALLATLTVGCTSDPESVCEDVGNCAQGGDSEWIQRCTTEAQSLANESEKMGCRSLYDDYYSCASSNFTCQGATPRFPGCDARLAALNRCLASAEAKSACAALSAKTTACGASGPSNADGGLEAGTSPGVPPACTANRDCEAQCFLQEVSNVCKPRIDELSSFVTCAESCPP